DHSRRRLHRRRTRAKVSSCCALTRTGPEEETVEPVAALARDPHRLYPSLLGGQRQRAFRTPFLLRGFRLAGPLLARNPALSRRAGGQPCRTLRRPGVVPGGLWRSRGRPHGLPPLALSGLFDSDLRLLFTGLAGSAVVRAGAQRRAAHRGGRLRAGPA